MNALDVSDASAVGYQPKDIVVDAYKLMYQRIGNNKTTGTIITTMQVLGFRAHLQVESLIPQMLVSAGFAVLTALNKQAFWSHESYPSLEVPRSHIQ